MEERPPKIRAVLLNLDYPVRPGKENGPEWFKDPARNILIIRVGDTAIPENLPVDHVIWNHADMMRFLAGQDPPIDDSEVLVVIDKAVGQYQDKRKIYDVGHRDFVDIDRIIRKIYLVEHFKQTGTTPKE